MNSHSREIKDIIGRNIRSLDGDEKGIMDKFSITFFDVEPGSYNIGITNSKITSISINIDESHQTSLLKKIVGLYGIPILGMESNLFKSVNLAEDEGNFDFGSVSSKVFFFEEAKIEDYLYIIWNTDTFMIHYYKPQTPLNDSSFIRIDIVSG